MKRHVIVADIKRLKEFESTDPYIGVGLGKWILVELKTGFDSIVGLRLDDKELTTEDEEKATAFGLLNGSILYSINASDFSVKQVNLTNGNSTTTIEIELVDTPSNVELWGEDNFILQDNGDLSFEKVSNSSLPDSVFFDFNDGSETGTVHFTNLPVNCVILLERTLDGKYSGLLLKHANKGYDRSGVSNNYNLTVVRGSGDGFTLQNRNWDEHRSEWSSSVNDYGPFRPLATSAQTSVAKDWTNGKLSVSYTGSGVYKFLFNDEEWFSYNMNEGSSLVGSGRATADEVIYKVGLMYGYSSSHQKGVITNVVVS